jgi:AcrR family transcriptional regulator
MTSTPGLGANLDVGAATDPGHPPASRRQRKHEATVVEIKSVARALMERDGTSSLNLRALAREMGIAPSALYRYFPSRDAILTALIKDAYDAVGEAVEQAVAAAPKDRTATAMLAAVHAFRSWSLSHPEEYGLIYGTPVPGYVAPAEETLAPSLRTNFVLLGELIRALEMGAVTPPDESTLPAAVCEAMRQVAQHDQKVDLGLSPAIWSIAMQFWVVLYGAISAEVFGHLPENVRGQAGAFFDYTMRRALVVMGVDAASVDAGVSPPF